MRADCKRHATERPYYAEDGFEWLSIYRRSYMRQRQHQPDLFLVTPGEFAYRRKRREVLGPAIGRLP